MREVLERYADGGRHDGYPEAWYELAGGAWCCLLWAYEEIDQPGRAYVMRYRGEPSTLSYHESGNFSSWHAFDWPGEWSAEGWRALKAALPTLLLGKML